MPHAFPSAKRLNQAGVLAVLKRGKRLSQADFELRFLISPVKGAPSGSKIAIAVPKRQLKSAAARNRIKRLVREEYRRHTAANAPLHMLVTFKTKNEGRGAEARRRLRIELASLLDHAASCVKAVNLIARAT